MSTVGINRELSPHCQSFIADAIELKQNNPDKFRSVFSVESPRIISRPVINKFGWWVLFSDISKFNIPKLELFNILLRHYEYISCPYEIFETRFIGENIPKEKIIWKGDLMILVFLFHELIYKNGVIPISTKTFYDLLADHFLFLKEKDKPAEELKHGSLKSSLNRARGNSVVLKTVENLITLLVSQ